MNMKEWVAGKTIVQPPQKDDIICRRGGNSHLHYGNRRFRRLVWRYQRRYRRCPSKAHVTVLTVLILRQCAGRFLKYKKETGTWLKLSDNDARIKIRQRLADDFKLLEKRQRSKVVTKLSLITRMEENASVVSFDEASTQASANNSLITTMEEHASVVSFDETSSQAGANNSLMTTLEETGSVVSFNEASSQASVFDQDSEDDDSRNGADLLPMVQAMQGTVEGPEDELSILASFISDPLELSHDDSVQSQVPPYGVVVADDLLPPNTDHAFPVSYDEISPRIFFDQESRDLLLDTTSQASEASVAISPRIFFNQEPRDLPLDTPSKASEDWVKIWLLDRIGCHEHSFGPQ